MFTYSSSKKFEWPFTKHEKSLRRKLGIDVSALIISQGCIAGGWPAEGQVLGVKLHSPVVISMMQEMFFLWFFLQLWNIIATDFSLFQGLLLDSLLSSIFICNMSKETEFIAIFNNWSIVSLQCINYFWCTA